MLKVNLHNYEAFFLDYIEGTLSDTDRKEVEKFLVLHPEKYDELQEFENITVSTEDTIQFNKSLLKKGLSDIQNITNDNFDEFCIASLEGDLDEKASEQYHNHLNKFPEKKKTEELYKKVYLVPDKNVKYPHKSKLKHFNRALFVRRLVFAGAAAASIGLLFTIQNLLNKVDDPTPQTPISQNTDVPKQNKEIANQVKEGEIQAENEFKKPNVAKVILTPNNPKEIIETEAVFVDQAEKRKPILLEKVDASKATIKTQTVSANLLAMSEGTSVPQTNVKKENKQVTLTEYAFNEIKKAIPDEVQELAEKRPNLLQTAENSRKEISDFLNKQISIEKDIDKEGNVKSFAINSSLFGFYTTKVKK